jgi:hypothetical protein
LAFSNALTGLSNRLWTTVLSTWLISPGTLLDFGRFTKVNHRGKERAGCHGHAGRRQRADDVQPEHGLDLRFLAGAVAADGRHDQQQHQHRSHGLEAE